MAGTLAHPVVVLVLGASTPVGCYFLQRASQISGLHLIAVSRHPFASAADGQLTWLQHDLDHGPVPTEATALVSFGPVGLAATQVQACAAIGRVVALSSASTCFKTDSPDPAEREQMARIVAAEEALTRLCEQRSAALSLFKTTMIYGGSSDRNVQRLGALIERLPLVPVTGKGLRAPVHADDLAELALRVLGLDARGTWLLGGGECLSYPDMLRRIAKSRGRHARLVPLPLWSLRPVLALARALGRLRDVQPAMLSRQAVDLVVDDSPARQQLGWNPRRFSP